MHANFPDPAVLSNTIAAEAREQTAAPAGPQTMAGVRHQSSAADQQFADYQAAGPSCRLNPYMDVAAVRRKFPHIADQPDDFLRSQSYSELAIANAAIAKLEDKASTAALDKKLAANFRDLKTKPLRVEAGWDDAIEQLHPAPGPACLLMTYWEKGQQHVPEAGIRALAHYDFESLAIGPNVSTKGCYFLHDPGSPHLTIKYFLASNFNITEKSITHSRSAELSTLSVEDQLVEPSSFTELQQALVAATLAQHIITPWNYSISALLGFMSSSRFCQASYASGWTSERVTMLRRFIDRVFSVNASHWRSKLPFLTGSEIGMLWQNWVLQIGNLAPTPAPAPAAGPSRSYNPSPRKQDQRSTYNTARFANMPPRDKLRNICRRYNTAEGCPTQGAACEVGSGNRRYTLLHQCLASVGPDRYCLQQHSMPQHNAAVAAANN